jgi:hypothetical protein
LLLLGLNLYRGSVVNFFIKIKFCGHLAMLAFWPLWADLASFLFSMPPKALLGAGFGNRILQNPVVKELRYQNLDNERLKVA